jgi:hypothetical protein
MEIKFAPSFFDSLKKMIRRERWYWKTWDFVRYDVPKGFKNIFFFWKVIWRYRDWDSSFQLQILKRSLEPLAKRLEKGNEVDISRLKKVDKIYRAIEILDHITNDSYIELAEKELGYQTDTTHIFSDEPREINEANRKIFDLSHSIEEKEWIELFEILKGQDREKYKKIIDSLTKEERKSEDVWDNWFDGSGIRGWWD